MAHSTPRVDGTVLVGVAGAASSIVVGSPAWYTWLDDATTFAFSSAQGGFTARKERSGRTGWYWKAYRKHNGTLYRAYLGKSADLTLERLTAIASDLAGHVTEPPPHEAPSVLSPAPASSHGDAQPLPAARLPTGTLTFLFTDIEGSTQLWEQYPQAMPAALARHDTIVRAAIPVHSGVVFKTVGDGMHAVFARAADALAATLAVQRALYAEAWGEIGPLRVRMALHTGAAELRDGDYFGGPLNRVARILALGHGGQILLSHATHDLVADDLPSQITLRALGEYPLKDLTRPEPIFQLVSPDFPSDFPPLRAAQNGPTPTPAPALSLLTTKLYAAPARHQLVARPRLLARLDAALTGKLTLLSAPAGFGKTTLVSAWRATAAGSAVPFAWVSLDTADSDPLRFWSYVITALDMLQPTSGASALALLQAPQPPPIEVVLTPLLNALSSLPTDAVLVLDDYHLIDASSIHTAVAFLLDHLPPQLHLILTTRADPPLPLTRLRVRGQLTELREADLRFTAHEAAAFLTELMGLPLSADDVAALEARTEGWIAGLQLAALAMRNHSDLAGFIRAFTGSHRFVVDYLAEEVIDRLPWHLQTFVLQTSVLERLCGPLCDALLAIGDWGLATENARAPNPQSPVSSPQAYSQLVLEELERANLFLIPLDDERRWYRYHHLFAEVLRARLQSGVSPDEVAALQLRASAWYEQQSLISEAIEYAILARDFERVARLANEHSERVWMRGGLATLLQWLSVLPDAAIEAHPRLALHHALILAVTDHSQLAQQRIVAAERALQTAAVPDVALLGRAQVVRAGIALLTDLPAEVTIAAGTRALELLPERDDFWPGFAGLFLGMGYYVQAGNPVAAYRILTEAEQAGMRAGDAVCASSAFSHRSIVLEMRGRLRESEHLNRAYLKQASEPAWQGVPLAAYARLGLGRVLYERNELAAAREQLLEAIQQLEAWALKRPLIAAYVTLSRLHQALGEAALAREAMERAVAIVQKANLKQTFSQWASFRMRLALMQGDMTAVAEWVQAIEPSTHGELDPALAFKHITLARIYLAQRLLEAAQQLLDRLLPSAQSAGRMGQVLDIYLLQALVLYVQGRETEAFAALERALTLAEPEGYVRIFVDEGAPMAVLLTQVARGEAAVAAYAASLLEAFPRTEGRGLRTESPESIHSVLSPQSSALVEPLSAREIEILRLIADGQSNQAIADTLVIAVSTVKRHINNIYGKLAVQSRTQALLRARELQLL